MDTFIKMNYFLDWNRYNANDKIGVKINTQTISPIWCPSNNKSNTIGNRRRQGARNTIINFCKLLRPNNQFLIFQVYLLMNFIISKLIFFIFF